MNRKQVAELKRGHVFNHGSAGDRSACSCGWDSGSRVGALTVGRQRHRTHVEQVVEAAKSSDS